MTELFQAFVGQVYAQVNTQVNNPVQNITNLQTLFNWIINLVLGVGLSLVIVMLAMGFIQYILSRGDKAALETAQKWVTYAAVGGVGLFLVFAARTVIESLFGKGSIQVGQGIVGGQND